MTALAFVIAGILLLLVGGTLLVRGASAVAAGFGVPPLVVGLTVVAFGTSTPELVVNIVGALNDATDLAFGNVAGSNISNLALVLGAAALMRPISIEGQLVRREIPLLLLATTMITVMVLDGPLKGTATVIDRSDSIILFLLFGVFVYISAMDFVRAKPTDALLTNIEDIPLPHPRSASALDWLLVAAGCGLLYFGGELTVNNGVAHAAALEIPATIVGLFVVAVGTSMPELVTSIIAAIREESDLALGNVIGSNIFNALVVLPASGVLALVPVTNKGIGDLVFSLLLAAVLIPLFLFGNARLGRGTGVVLILVYFGYAVFRITGS